MPNGRRALVVAADEFDDLGLRTLVAPRRDAADLARILADPDIGGFEVSTILNRPRHEVERAIARFFSAGERDDTLLLYFSGHGLKDENGMLYFAMTDTEVDLLSASAVSSSFVSGQLGRARAQTKIVLLDCCYSGAFSRSLMTKDDRLVNAAEELRGIGRVVITASNALQYSFEGRTPSGDAHQSVFTKHLVVGLETGAADLDGDGRIAVDELYRYVHEQVVKENPQQRPSISIETQGMVVMATSRAGVRPAPLPDELLSALANTLPRIRLGAVGELLDLLGGTDRRTAAAARAALEKLLDDDSRRVTEAAAAALAAEAMSASTETALDPSPGHADGRQADALPPPPAPTEATEARLAEGEASEGRPVLAPGTDELTTSPPDPGPAPDRTSLGGRTAVGARSDPASAVPGFVAEPPHKHATTARLPLWTGPLGLAMVGLAGILLIVSLLATPWHRPDCLSSAQRPSSGQDRFAAGTLDADLPGLLLVSSALEDAQPGTLSADCGVNHLGALAAAFAGVAVVLAGVAVTGRTRMTERQSVWTRRVMRASAGLATVAVLSRLVGPGNVGADELPGNDLALGLAILTLIGALLALRRPDQGVVGAAAGP